jgi:hypothetical protein
MKLISLHVKRKIQIGSEAHGRKRRRTVDGGSYTSDETSVDVRRLHHRSELLDFLRSEGVEERLLIASSLVVVSNVCSGGL